MRNWRRASAPQPAFSMPGGEGGNPFHKVSLPPCKDCVTVTAMTALPRRTPRGDLLASLPKGGVCAEIGTWRGNFAAEILGIKQPERIYLVDPWRFMDRFPGRWYGGADAKNQSDMDEIAAAVERRFSGDDRVLVRRMTSGEFFEAHQAERFDWVYIDGDHSEEAVYADLSAAWPLIRPGGILSGDDYYWTEAGRRPVAAAVERFKSDVGLEPDLLAGQFSFPKPA